MVTSNFMILPLLKVSVKSGEGQYPPGNAELESLEGEARQAKLGVWGTLILCPRGSGGRENRNASLGHQRKPLDFKAQRLG